MNTAEIINSIKEHVAAAYTAVTGKDGTVPGQKNLSNLAAAIESIQMGSGAENKLAQYASGELTEVTARDLKDITTINPYAFAFCNRLTSATIPDSVTTINMGAFYSCTALSTVTIGRGVTSIGEGAFYGCNLTTLHYTGDVADWCNFSDVEGLMSNVTSLYINGQKVEGDLVIPEGPTSIGRYAFHNCTDLTSITIPSTVTNIGSSAFDGCDKLTTVYYTGDIAGWNRISGLSNLMSNVTTLYINGQKVEGDLIIPDGTTNINDYAFYHCSDLTSVSIPNGVTSIGSNAFSNCPNLTNVTIPDSMTSIGYNAFNNCSKLTSIAIPDSVTNINDAFNNCTGLTNITGSANNVVSVSRQARPTSFTAIITSGTRIDNSAFSDFTGLTSIIIPNSVTSIGENAFKNCNNLTSITLPFAGESKTASDYRQVFGYIFGYTKVRGGDEPVSGATYQYRGSDSYDYYYYIPSSLVSVTITGESISNHAFYNCSNLTNIEISNNTTSIGSYAFYNCNALTSIAIPNSVTHIDGGAFSGCYSLTNVVIPDSVTDIGGSAFYGCSGLTSVIIGNNVTNIGSSAFYGCSGLTDITIPNSVTNIYSYVFDYCNNLTTIYYTGDIADWCKVNKQSALGSNVTSLYINDQRVEGDLIIPAGVTSIGNFTFYDCTDLTSITIPDSVTNIGASSFDGCNDLTTAYYLGDFEGWNKISGLDNLMSKITTLYINGQKVEGDLIIPDGVTSISDYAFYNCSDLTNVTIPNSVTNIGSSAFYNCNKLTNIAIPDKVTNIGSNAFYNCSKLENVTIPNSITNIGYQAFNNTIIKNIYITDLAAWCGIAGIDGLTWAGSLIKNLYLNNELVTSLTIPNSVTTINEDTFAHFNSFTSVTIPDNVTKIGDSAFYRCFSLVNVTIGSGVTSIDNYAFGQCNKLVEVYNKSTLSITVGSSSNGYIGYYAKNIYNVQGGSKLSTDENGYTVYTDGTEKILIAYNGSETDLTLPTNITQIYKYALYNCDNLTNITIPDSITSIGENAFNNCSSLANITGSISNIKTITQQITKDSLLTVTITRGTSIDNNNFNYFSSLTSITNPNSITSIGNSAFNYCNKLTTIYYAGDITSWCAIEGLYSLMSSDPMTLYINGQKIKNNLIIPDNVTSINEYAFYNCRDLTSVTIGNNVTSIGDGAFYNCNKLVEVYNKSSLTITAGKYDNGYVAYYAKNVYTTEGENKLSTDENGYVIYTDGIEKILITYAGTETELVLPVDITQIYKYAFYNHKDLTSITIGSNVTNIGDYAFQYCKGLTSIVVNEGNTKYHSAGNCLIETATKTLILGCKASIIPDDGSVTNISNSAFSDCVGLTSITIPDSVTNIGTAFSGCRDLVNVVIGNGITVIGSHAFGSCNSLTNITIGNKVTSIDYDAFNRYNSLQNIYITDIAAWCSISGLNNLMNNNNSSNKNLYLNNELISSVVIPDSVTSINECAFYNCNSLISVTIGNNVTSINYDAFSYCTNLTSITIPDSVTNISNHAFDGCKKLKTVYYTGDIAGWCKITGLSNLMPRVTSLYINDQKVEGDLVIPDGVTSIGDNIFRNCTGLTSVTIPNGVTNIGSYAFSNCSGLMSITIPGSVTSISSNSFDGCKKLKTIYYTGDVASWCKISGLEDLMPNITSLYINGQKVEGNLIIPNGVTNIGTNTFRNCTGLTSVTIPDSVTNISSHAFSKCTGLTNAIIGNGVATIGESAFYGCSSLESITIPFVGAKANLTNSDAYQYPFGYIFGTSKYPGGVATDQYYYGSDTSSTTHSIYYIPSSLKSVTVMGGNILYGAFNSCSGLTNIIISDNVTSIGGNAFSGCKNLVDVTIGNGVTSIGGGAFSGCSSLTSITIPDNVTSIGGNVFNGCKKLINVTIGNGVTSIGNYTFSGCSDLTSITIGDSVTSIGEGAFSNCNNLQNIYITDIVAWCNISRLDYLMNNNSSSNKNLYLNNEPITSLVISDGATTIPSYAFYKCNNLTNVTISDSVTSINDYAFYDCRGLTNVLIGNGVTNIDAYAFAECSSLIDIVIPNNVTNMGVGSFNNCRSLTNVTIGNGITNIPHGCFTNCNSLISIVIPDTVTNIVDYTFQGCNRLKTVFYAGTEEQWGTISISSNGNSSLTSATIIYSYDGIERTYSFVSNCDQNVDSITAKYLTSLPTLTKDSFYFGGWYDNETFEGEAVSTPYYSKDKTTLYAKWFTQEEWDALPDGTSFEKAYIAKSKQTYDVNITKGGQIVYFTFTPKTNGSFTIQSIGNIDTHGTLYDSTQSSLTQDDDGAGGGNFRITYNMTADTTYYIAARLYSSSNTGTFKVSFS